MRRFGFISKSEYDKRLKKRYCEDLLSKIIFQDNPSIKMVDSKNQEDMK